MPKEMYEFKQVNVRLKLQEAEPLYSEREITDSDVAVEIMAKALSEMDREYCCVVNLDARKHPINFNIVSMGDTAMTQIPIQNIFKAAILSNSSSVICFHNHPSGYLSPSNADKEVTKRMVEAGRIMGIPVTDHIIVAGGSGLHTSIRGLNPELFSFAADAKSDFVAEPEKRASLKQKIAEKQALITSNKEKPLMAVNTER